MTGERETLTWHAFGDASRAMAQAIADDGYRPDIILAIARGGLFFAGALGYALAVKNLHVMNVEFYNGVGSTQHIGKGWYKLLHLQSSRSRRPVCAGQSMFDYVK